MFQFIYRPCVHGTCLDRRAGWFCDCPPKFGGKNCSVELTGCNQEQTCLNNGTCKPYLVGETQHRFNCTCPSGFHGPTCEKVIFSNCIKCISLSVSYRFGQLGSSSQKCLQDLAFLAEIGKKWVPRCLDLR